MELRPEPSFIIGIDLGTTNSALSYVENRPDADPFALPKVELLAIPQLVNPSEVRDETLLPSFLYIPGATDFPAGATALPWDPKPETIAGRLAQKRGVENAGRLVSSAKSWLSHGGVDRTAPNLPSARPKACPSIRRSRPAAAISIICATPGITKCPTRPSPSSTCW